MTDKLFVRIEEVGEFPSKEDMGYYAARLTGLGFNKIERRFWGYRVVVDSEEKESKPKYREFIVATCLNGHLLGIEGNGQHYDYYERASVRVSNITPIDLEDFENLSERMYDLICQRGQLRAKDINAGFVNNTTRGKEKGRKATMGKLAKEIGEFEKKHGRGPA